MLSRGWKGGIADVENRGDCCVDDGREKCRTGWRLILDGCFTGGDLSSGEGSVDESVLTVSEVVGRESDI